MAAYARAKKGIAGQRTSEDGLSAETSRTQQKDFDKRETLRIQISKYEFLNFDNMRSVKRETVFEIFPFTCMTVNFICMQMIAKFFRISQV